MNKSITIRLSRRQYERIKNNADLKGFNTLSDFLRYMGMHEDLTLQGQVSEIHRHPFDIKPKRNSKKIKIAALMM